VGLQRHRAAVGLLHRAALAFASFSAAMALVLPMHDPVVAIVYIGVSSLGDLGLFASPPPVGGIASAGSLGAALLVAGIGALLLASGARRIPA
jgi:hypothetical protein